MDAWTRTVMSKCLFRDRCKEKREVMVQYLVLASDADIPGSRLAPVYYTTFPSSCPCSKSLMSIAERLIGEC